MSSRVHRPLSGGVLRARSSRRGAAAIEFGLWVFILVVLVAGLIDFSWYMSRSEVVMRAARDGARTAAATNDGDKGTDVAEDIVDALGMSGCTVTTTGATGTAGLVVYSTNVSCDYTSLMGMTRGLPTDIEYSFTMFSDFQVPD